MVVTETTRFLSYEPDRLLLLLQTFGSGWRRSTWSTSFWSVVGALDLSEIYASYDGSRARSPAMPMSSAGRRAARGALNLKREDFQLFEDGRPVELTNFYSIAAASMAPSSGAANASKRKETVEPVFGQIKEARGIRRFLLRGLGSVQAEWSLICATHNLLKLFRSGWSPQMA